MSLKRTLLLYDTNKVLTVENWAIFSQFIIQLVIPAGIKKKTYTR